MYQKQLQNNFIVAVLLGMLIGLAVLSMIASHHYLTADGGAMSFALRWLSLPLFLINLAVVFRFFTSLRTVGQKIGAALFVTIFCCTIGSGGLLFINASIGHQQEISIHGYITSKSSGGHRGSPTITVGDSRLGYPITLQVTRNTYDSVGVGSLYNQMMYRGFLGILYQTTF
jgi:hypothetical protein